MGELEGQPSDVGKPRRGVRSACLAAVTIRKGQISKPAGRWFPNLRPSPYDECSPREAQ
jgi:hypothetical protein